MQRTTLLIGLTPGAAAATAVEPRRLSGGSVQVAAKAAALEPYPYR